MVYVTTDFGAQFTVSLLGDLEAKVRFRTVAAARRK